MPAEFHDALAPPSPPPAGLLARSRRHLHDNHMVRNSMYSLLSSGLQAGLGFAFWILATRMFNAPAVGRATSLIAATTVIAFVALFGLNSTLGRYLPTSAQRDTMVTVSLLIVGVGGTLIAVGYVVALPLIAPQLRFLDDRIFFALSFALLSGATAVNLVTDAVFIASRRTGINLLVDGGIGGVVKVALVPVLAGTGAYGLYCASSVGFAAAAYASVLLMWTQLHYRPRIKMAVAVMRPLLRFSTANYLANVFNLVPGLVVTLIVLDRLGAVAAAYYFVAFQVANLIYAGAFAVEQNFLAEGARGEEPLTRLMWRAAKMLTMMAVPAALVGAVLAHPILLLFGHSYALQGSETLMFMALAAIPIAAQNWLVTVLRLTGQLLAITVSNAVYAGAICGLAWFLAPRGLGTVGVAWLLGSSAGVVVATAAVVHGARRGALVR